MQRVPPSTWAWVSIVGFVALFGSFAIEGRGPWVPYVTAWGSAVGHLALFPLVAALPGVAWARPAGYMWASVDTILSVAALNGLPIGTSTELRLGLHVVVAFWLAAVALASTGGLRVAAGLFTVAIAIPSLFGPVLPPSALFAVMPFLFAFLFTVAVTLRRRDVRPAAA
ncbi:MAG TPA: hypothetical protein VI997_01800 [Candidatus Thermoplasmatota archaeon]|nr:hypothetical protein [Candidatus Thermoplasmatota archaeon]